MKNDDGCLVRAPGGQKTASEGQRTASAHVYLMEELGDARMRCDQLVRYVEQATKLIDNSSHKDHFFEVAGHLIEAIPVTLFKLQKALQAVALAATRIDYEEIKQDLRPEKVQQLERVLQDVRIRQVPRRSQPWTPQEAAQELRNLAAYVKETGWLDRAGLLGLISGLEVGLKTASESPEEALGNLAEVVESSEDMSRLRLAALLRRILADHILGDPTTELRNTMDHTTQDAWKVNATGEGAPSVDPWKIDAAAGEVNVARLERMVDITEKQLKEMKHSLGLYKKDPGRYKPQLDNLAAAASSVMTGVRMGLRAMGHTKFASEEEEKESRFEEGKPADPTKNMSPEDAKKWRKNNELYEDKFKEEKGEVIKKVKEADWKVDAASRVAPKDLFKDMKDAVKKIIEARVAVRRVHEKLTTLKNDATGIFWTDNYGNPDIEKVRDRLYRLDSDLAAFSDIERLERTLQPMAVKTASEEEEKESRFEEGKPADPTKNMSPEDAKKWKQNKEEYGDKFKSAARTVPIEKAQKGDMVSIEVGTPWPNSSKKEKVTGKVVRVKKDGVVTVDVEKSRSNPGGHSNEDVGYVDVRTNNKSASEESYSYARTAAYPTNMLERYPSGRWGFVGQTHPELTYIKKDGTKPTDKDFENARHAGPAIAGLKTRTWNSAEEALKDAKKLNQKVTIHTKGKDGEEALKAAEKVKGLKIVKQ